MGYGLVLVSHGGESSESNRVAREHGEKLFERDDLDIEEIEYASIHRDDLSEKIKEMCSDRIFVLPFLTSPGKHYNQDIPSEINEVEGKDVELLDTFGDHKYVTEALASILKDVF